jgi:uncharacterized protein with HEPN domain
MNDRDRAALEAARASARVAREHVRAGGPRWRDNQMVVDAAAKRVEEVGEILKRVSPARQAAMPGIRWRQAKGMRERIAHDYGRIDLDILEGVVETDLPSLIDQIDAALADFR